MRLVLVLAVAVVLPLPAIGANGYSIEMGGTFYNFGGVSGTSQQLGNVEFSNFG